MDNEQNVDDCKKNEITNKLQQINLTDKDLNIIGYFKSPLLDFLQTETGNAFGQSIINLINNFSQKHHTTYKWDTISKVGCVILVIVSTSLLLYFGKFEPSIGVLFGTIVGFLFGKNNKE